jgi:hypothetical protein
MSNYKGRLEGFPSEVVEKMLERQVEQGNKRDVGVFEKFKWADDIFGGFHWANTKEGDDFWQKVIAYKDFALFFSRYPKKDKFTPISEETGKKIAEAMEKLRQNAKLEYIVKEIDSLINFTSSSNMGELTLSSEWKPKEGDVVTIESPRGKTISIFKSGEISWGNIWNFYAALHYANGFLVDELIWDKYSDAKIRPATYEERCTFFSRLVNEGYKWNAKKLKLTKWVPKDGDFLYWENKISGVYGICILEGQYLGSGEDFFYYVHLASNNTLRYTKVIGKENRMDRPATDSERQRLLDALRKEGKRWNAEKKRVEDIEPGYRRSAKMGAVGPLKWKPKRNEMYYFVELNSINLYSCAIWEDDEFDNTCYNHGIIFRTEEETISCAKKMLEKCVG